MFVPMIVSALARIVFSTPDSSRLVSASWSIMSLDTSNPFKNIALDSALFDSFLTIILFLKTSIFWLNGGDAMSIPYL